MAASKGEFVSYLLINSNDFNQHLADVIKSIDKVEYVNATEGAFDIVTKIKTRNYAEFQNLLHRDFEKIIDTSSALVLMRKDKGCEISEFGEIPTSIEEFDNYNDCDFCGLTLPLCHCKCPYCGERDKCECAIGDAATGG